MMTRMGLDAKTALFKNTTKETMKRFKVTMIDYTAKLTVEEKLLSRLTQKSLHPSTVKSTVDQQLPNTRETAVSSRKDFCCLPFKIPIFGVCDASPARKRSLCASF